MFQNTRKQSFVFTFSISFIIPPHKKIICTLHAIHGFRWIFSPWSQIRYQNWASMSPKSSENGRNSPLKKFEFFFPYPTAAYLYVVFHINFQNEASILQLLHNLKKRAIDLDFRKCKWLKPILEYEGFLKSVNSNGGSNIPYAICENQVISVKLGIRGYIYYLSILYDMEVNKWV